MNIYDFNVKDIKGQEVSLKAYKNKILLIVNTATECGFTPQYEDLEGIYEVFHDKGLEILDFPCDQFGHQAPGTNDQIAQFCTARFGVTFPQFAKIEVNGENQHPLFAYLKEKQTFKGFHSSDKRAEFMHKMLLKQDKDYASKSDIKWNFTKFLVDQKGTVIQRFEPTESMDRVALAIKNLIK